MLSSCSVMSASLRPHGLQHARLPCPSLLPGVCSNSCPLNRWCYPTVLPSVVPLSSCFQLFLASGSIPVSQPFALSGHSIVASASGSVFPINNYIWFHLGLTDFISLLSKGLSRVFSSNSLKGSVLPCSAYLIVQLSHLDMTTRKTIALTIRTFVDEVISLLFNTQSRFVIAFLPRSKHLLISCL